MSDATAHRLPRGFVGAVAAAGIKASAPTNRPDMALIACPGGATAAAMFTRNLVCAAPLSISRRHLAMSRGHASALLINSGCANAATGAEGESRAIECVDAVARALEVASESVLVNSTGVIGVQLPIDRMLPRVSEMVGRLSENSLPALARAIMTTDTHPKSAMVEIEHPDPGCSRRCVVSGIAKGAGMIHPDMSLAGEAPQAPPQATMISVLMTDAEVDPAALARILKSAVDGSFHRISIDGDTSTNDAVFALASGVAGAFPERALAAAFRSVARELALMVVRDGEGFERGIEVVVTGAPSEGDALAVARTIATSLLVRCAVTGGSSASPSSRSTSTSAAAPPARSSSPAASPPST
jgi:glutamate N-acetyltransferase / amino-acid N-acetyltransferase